MANGDSLLSEVGQGLKSILPYALPAALGFGLGGPMGALAGIASSQPDPETQIRQQELGLEQRKEGIAEQSETLALQAKQRELEAQQALGQDPGFQKFVQQNLGISPEHMEDFVNLDPSQQKDFLSTAAKIRATGMKFGPVTKGPNGWYATNLQTGEQVPMGEPATAYAGDQANARTATTQAAATNRTELAQAGATARTATTTGSAEKRAAAARTEKAIEDFDKARPPSRWLNPTGWRDDAVRAYVAAGKTPEDAEKIASAKVGLKPRSVAPPGFVPAPGRTYHGKPAYYNPLTKKYWSADS